MKKFNSTCEKVFLTFMKQINLFESTGNKKGSIPSMLSMPMLRGGNAGLTLSRTEVMFL